jgi:hypothetical protein
MRTWTLAIVLGVVATLAARPALAGEKNIGKHSQDEIKKACNAVGGDLLGVSDLGSYGCEVPSKGTMILCNKNQECTGYTPAQRQVDQKRILDDFGLGARGRARRPMIR